jgi:glutamate dehydrogenase
MELERRAHRHRERNKGVCPMAGKADAQKAELIESLVAAVGKRLGGTKGAQASAFVRHYLGGVGHEDVGEVRLEDLEGAAIGMFSFARKRQPAETKIRVFNPTYEEHGWESTHTIVEIVNRDMPFLVDSTVAALNRAELTVHLLIHPVVRIGRDAGGRLVSLDGAEDAAESVIHVEVSQQPSGKRLQEIEAEVRRVLDDVGLAVEDWKPMLARIDDIIAELTTAPLPADEIEEGRAFLEWMRDDHFTLIGCRDYALKSKGGKDYLQIVDGSGLGVLRHVSEESAHRHNVPLPRALARFARRKELLIITKASAHSTVHRPVYMDYIGVRRFDAKGTVIGERRLLGLFTSGAYNRNPHEIPLLRRKVSRIVERSGFRPGGHNAKALRNILDTFPRDELFQIGEDELLEMAQGIRHLEERQRIRLFMRRDTYARFVSCLVYAPRERFNTELRRRFEEILIRAFDGRAVEYTTHISESPMARVHFIVRTNAELPPFDVTEIEAKLVEASRVWADDLREALIERWGEAHGNALYHRYRFGFQPGYSDLFSARTAVADIAHIEATLETGDIAMNLYHRVESADDRVNFKLYHIGRRIMLSDVLPMLEHMGLRVVGEAPFEITPKGQETVFLHDFEMQAAEGSEFDLGAIRDTFQEAFWQVWRGHMEDDGLNALVFAANLGWREVTVMRAYCKVLRQAGITFSQRYIEATLRRNPAVVRILMRLFAALFAPDPADKADPRAILDEASAALDNVASLDEDRILRRFLNLFESTLRTNFYQLDGDGGPKPYLSFKLDSKQVAELPLPRPMVEIFIYAPRVEAVHLRGGRVARGGIRWSDRPEDFRTEVLGLMKAQMVKNAVIVPVGSKGGFVVKRPPAPTGDRKRDRQALLDEVIECYKTMQRGMLDLTDNLKGDRAVPPPRVVRRDGDDPYLVVAADKGTATFSDIANEVSEAYGHWLGDAYASGGSAGYDHKKMGITARGAWESVKRHFREIGTDVQAEDFTVVGVGDMAGDVFGNGMLLSRHVKLVGAFNHLHVFVDPDPDPAVSWAERRRLFDNALGWGSYDTALIGKGGGVFDRTAKSIKLTPEIKRLFELDRDTVTPADLIRAMLRAPVQLLWFGGIGTYVKASEESNVEVGDRANDALRVDGRELRARVVGEGANLAVTQRGRIEYALAGGRLNTDAVDNSAGVDCSDHEVNIKILLNAVVDAGDMTRKQRDKLLERMTDEVAALVLRDNYQQTQAITIEEGYGVHGLDRNQQLMRVLERADKLNRAIEFLPDDEALAERLAAGRGLTRPEISVLLAYAKMVLYEELLPSDLPEERLLLNDLVLYFPTPLRQNYRKAILRHPLHREIIATYVTNSMVNRVGPSFLHTVQQDTGMAPADIARAYAITRDAFELRALWRDIEGLDNQVPAATQTAMHREAIQLIDRCTRWFLRYGGYPLYMEAHVEDYAPGIGELREALDTLLSERDAAAVAARTGELAADGVPEALARQVASLEVLSSACDIVRIARTGRMPVVEAGRVYFGVGARFGIDWLRAAAAALAGDSHWQKLAIRAVVEELFSHQSELTVRVLKASGRAKPAGDGVIDGWIAARQAAVTRTEELLGELRSAGGVDLAMLAVANRQLRAMIGD